VSLFHKRHSFTGGYIDPALKRRLDEAARRAGLTRVRVIATALALLLDRADVDEVLTRAANGPNEVSP
jgi:hypothetical protein